MKKVLDIIVKEFGTLLVAIIAVALVYPYFWIWIIPVSLLTVGVIYTLSKPFYDYRGRSWKERWKRIGKWVLNVLYQTWVVIKKAFLFVGFLIDLYGNVILGELIEDLVTAEEDTLFGLGDITISAALGDLKRRGKLNKTGIWFCNVLSKLDPKHEDHCIAAIELYEFKKNQK
jgi:hypothetical protein